MQDMDLFGSNGNDNEDSLPPPPPIVPPDVEPVKVEQELPPEPAKKKVFRHPIARRGVGSKGTKLSLLTNHFSVNVANTNGHFYQYSVRPLLFCRFVAIISMFSCNHSPTLDLSRCLFLMKMDAL